MTDFERWFKQQFGALPNARASLAAENRVAALSQDLAAAKSVLDHCNQLQYWWQAAMYARNMCSKCGQDENKSHRPPGVR